MTDEVGWNNYMKIRYDQKLVPQSPTHFQWITACPCCGRILSPVDMAHECKCGQLISWGSVNG